MTTKENNQAVAFFIDDQGRHYQTLDVLAQSGPFGAAYLSQMAKAGQLKAFKAGGQWLSTADWVSEYQTKVKKAVHSELAHAHESGRFSHHHWARPVKQPLSRKLNPRLSAALAGIILFFGSISAALIILVGAAPGRSLASANDFLDRRTLAAEGFLMWTDSFYGTPLALIKTARERKIPDEKLTEAWQALMKQASAITKNRLGRVAGVSEPQEH